ncbi:hypothetical protein BU17DRAFT_99115 [Hysterangium stoloniferum]|nr:hypothetical protein BU17DRAFT_99115 [Hysterangium stoloniferum]
MASSRLRCLSGSNCNLDCTVTSPKRIKPPKAHADTAQTQASKVSSKSSDVFNANSIFNFIGGRGGRLRAFPCKFSSPRSDHSILVRSSSDRGGGHPWVLGTECIDNARKGKGQSLKVKRACASCRADKVQCEVDRPYKRCVKRNIQCADPCRACGCEESLAEASTSSSLQDKATPTSPSSPPESPLSPYSGQSPHNHAAVCVPDADSHNSGSQGHNPPTPTPSPSSRVHMAAPTLDPHGMGLYSEDHEESSRSPTSPLSPHSLQVPTTASLYHTTPHPVEPHSYSEGNAQRLVSPPSCYPSQRRHSGLYDPPMESDESAPTLSPLRMHSHLQDEALPASSSLSYSPKRTLPPRRLTQRSLVRTLSSAILIMVTLSTYMLEHSFIFDLLALNLPLQIR